MFAACLRAVARAPLPTPTAIPSLLHGHAHSTHRAFHTTTPTLAGHNKWSKIRHKKGENDLLRGRLVGKISTQITSSARRGGKDPATNMELAGLLKKAKAEAIPKSSVEAALKKAEGGEKLDLELVTYEVLGPGGVALMVDALTDNKKRVLLHVRNAVTNAGGSLAAVAFQFEKKGVIRVSPGTSGHDLSTMTDTCIDLGVEDIEDVEDPELTVPQLHLTTPPSTIRALSLALESLSYDIISLDPAAYVPLETVDLGENEQAWEELERLVRAVEDVDEVVRVAHNAV
ncbi:YebC-like protein [Gonapodya prolifera JEL478]|uniref:YebC-like protein n=1 Tax=Gonapodya prolifera (strain JEL478) TaxID=1344416 RepID=A0A139A3V4_GONPJ|nr:YebC-like protein [Gonapodya prolifera JEL478]|eukprot:KXS11471.1 YebC-like protein [Gonapodya prolifera JEL478]